MTAPTSASHTPPTARPISDALERVARAHAEHAHPHHHTLQRAAEHADHQWREVRRDAGDLRFQYDARLSGYGRLAHTEHLDQHLERVDQQITQARAGLDRVNHRLHRLAHEPVVAAQPAGWLDTQHDQWQADQSARTATLQRVTQLRGALAADAAARERMRSHMREYQQGQHVSREGPSFRR